MSFGLGSHRVLVALALSSAASLITGQQAEAVIIQPTFDGSITSAGNATDIENAIYAAAAAIAPNFTDQGTVNILFAQAHGGFLGASETGLYYTDYASFVSLLAFDAANHPENAPINSGVANIPAVGSQPFVWASSADWRVALGVSGATPCFDSGGNFVTDGSGNCIGTFDGVIFLSSDEPINYVRPTPAYDGTNLMYDARRVIEHEIDEILGVGGASSSLNAVDQNGGPFGIMGAMDLYRYASPGVQSFTTDANAAAYFSVDGGVTNIIDFNQFNSGDYGDWAVDFSQLCPGNLGFGGSGHVQDAFSCNNQEANFSNGSPEYLGLEAVGYDPVPEPSSLALLSAALLSIFGLAFARRRQLSI